MNKPSPLQKKKTKSDYDAASERFFRDKVKDKAAESLAMYTPTRRRTASSAPRRIAGIAASNEVWRFAARNDLLAHLETAVRLAKECFWQVGKLSFTYDIDPEIENEAWISIHADIQGSLDELLQQHLAYGKALVRVLPKAKLPLIRFAPGLE